MVRLISIYQIPKGNKIGLHYSLKIPLNSQKSSKIEITAVDEKDKKNHFI